MLIQDHLGYWHDVPESRFYGVQHVGYDGLGNPVGLPILAALAPLASALAPAIGDIVGGLFGGKKSEPAPPPEPPPAPSLPPPPPAPDIIVEPLAPPPPAIVRALPRASVDDCPPCPVCPVCGQAADGVGPPSAMPIRPGTRLVRIRRRRRVHVRTR